MAKKKSPIIGTFRGECADANVTNENGLDITREVWENVFNSDIYKQAIDLHWYLGYLGHPEDVDCMDFQNACVVMTEGHIDNDGKVYGTFDLIDTPVGRIVKTFIDAGTTFGISVRGAGDIYNNSVDPDTFVFRGFDLVTFPAYKEAIPEFKEIAASTDNNQRQKYQSVCKSVEKELDKITSCETINVIKNQFPEQSDTFKTLEAREAELSNYDQKPIVENTDDNANICNDVKDQKIEGLTSLYLSEKKRADDLQQHVNDLALKCSNISIQAGIKSNHLTRIVADQQSRVDEIEASYQDENKKLTNRNRVLVTANRHLKESLQDIDSENSRLSHQLQEQKKQNRQIIMSQKTIDKLKSQNLSYQEKIEANDKLIRSKDSRIDELEEKLDKTVIEANTSSQRLSNLENKNRELKEQIKASNQRIAEYQDAYASMYSQALGVGLANIPVTASTSVKDLQSIIAKQDNSYSDDEDIVEPQLVDVNSMFDDSGLITV